MYHRQKKPLKVKREDPGVIRSSPHLTLSKWMKEVMLLSRHSWWIEEFWETGLPDLAN